MSFLNKITAQLPFGNKSENTEYYFALSVSLSEVTGVVWSLFGKQLDILGQATLPYEGTEDLLDKAYKTLDQSLGILEINPEKVLFGVPDSWSVEDTLKEPYLKLLRRMIKEYDLEPMAYVTTTNAIAHLLQKQEGAAQTAVLLGVGDFIEATLVRGGKIAESRSAKRGDQLFDDIEKLLRQFTEIEVLPSRILIYSSKQNENLSKIKDDLMSYPWMQRLSFLHFPKIEILDENISSEALAFAGAIELNPEVDLRHSFSTVKHSLSRAGSTGPTGAHHLSAEKSLPKEEGVEEEKVEEDENLGFVEGDIKKHQEDDIKFSDNIEKVSPEEEENLEEDNLISPDLPGQSDFIENTPSQPLGFKRSLTRLPLTRGVAEEVGFLEHQYQDLGKMKIVTQVLSKVKSVLKIPSFGGGKGRRGFGKLLSGKILIGVAVFAAIIAAYLLLVKASVTIYVEPKILEKDTQVIADPKVSSIDEEKEIIPGEVVETTVSGSGKGTATGTKQIGDPAKGKVVVYNLTAAKVSFSQGSTLTSGNGLKFTLDSSVQVASQSSSIGANFVTVITPGKSEAVGVTAVVIGPDSNLPAGSDLVLGGYAKAQVVARVEEALSGGTSKNVTVVTSDDQKKLQAKVVDELRQKAEADVQTKIVGGKKIISEALSVVDGKYNFNKQVNDQASEFSLSATVRFKGTAYSDNDLRTIVSKLVSVDVPAGYELNLGSAETQADVDKVEKDGRLIFKAKFRAKLLPKYNVDEIKSKMRGRTPSEVADELKGLEGVMGSEIKTVPALPGPLARMPFLSKNISVIVTPK